MVSGFVQDMAGIHRIQTAGSLRRRAETIGDVDILVTAKKWKGSDEAGGRIIQAFTGAGFVREVLAAGPTKGSAIIQTHSIDVHTTASDGESEIAELAEAAKALGYQYICITDHSKSSAIANGLSPKQSLR